MLDSRVDYIDNIKALACALVAIGHFVMSMDASNILSYNVVTEWFKDTIYLFHVNLFFICSGFLYIFSLNQKNNYHYFSFVMKKLLALGIPYFFFTAVTVLLKMWRAMQLILKRMVCSTRYLLNLHLPIGIYMFYSFCF